MDTNESNAMIARALEQEGYLSGRDSDMEVEMEMIRPPRMVLENLLSVMNLCLASNA